MWSETVGLRTRPVWDQKNRSWSCTLRCWSCRSARCCFVKRDLVTLVVIINQWRWQTQAPKCLEIYVRIILSTLYYIRIQPNNYTYILRSVSSSGKISWRTQQLFKYYLLFLYSVLGTSLLWRSTVAFTYLKVKSAKYLTCLLPVVLVLLFWSGSWFCMHCRQRSWSWSYILVLVLVSVLRIWSCLHHWTKDGRKTVHASYLNHRRRKRGREQRSMTIC